MGSGRVGLGRGIAENKTKSAKLELGLRLSLAIFFGKPSKDFLKKQNTGHPKKGLVVLGIRCLI